MAGKVEWESDTLTPGIASFPAKLNAAIDVFMDYQSGPVQDYMRNNAPWTDRSGNARGGLFARGLPGEQAIVCYHTVSYGIWLEVAHDGVYRIIDPTIQTEGARIMSELPQVLDRLT